MSKYRNKLQQDLFLPSDERLVSACEVVKFGKKKKEKQNILCLAVTQTEPVQLLLYLVRRPEKGDIFKKKVQWHARELKKVDGKHTDKKSSSMEFDLLLDKTYRWIAPLTADGLSFLTVLWKMCQRLLIQKPQFSNLPPKIVETIEREAALADSQDTSTSGLTLVEDYQALSAREEQDFLSVMKETDSAISDAETFTEKLTARLSMLDGANEHDMMGSEEQVMRLVGLIDKALHEATLLEQKLDRYDDVLQGVKDYMSMMKEKDSTLQTQSKNHQKLIDSLDDVVETLDLHHKHTSALLDGDLSTPIGVNTCTEAAIAVQKALQSNIDPSLMKVSGIDRQYKMLVKLKTTFTQKLSRHLNNLFIYQANELGSERRLQPHNAQHRDLLTWQLLMNWLKSVDTQSFNQLKKVYVTSIGRCYQKQIRDVFENIRMSLSSRQPHDRLKAVHAATASGRLGSQDSIDRLDKQRSGSKFSLDEDRSQLDRFDQHFNGLLKELGPYVQTEQDFCNSFFNFSPPHIIEGDADGASSGKNSRQVLDAELSTMMDGLFGNLEEELKSLIHHSEKIDPCFCLLMMMRLQQHTLSAEDTYLCVTFGSCLVSVKRSFDKLVQNKIDSWQDAKTSKKGRCGILPLVHEFDEFASQAEKIFEGSTHRSELDKAYVKLTVVVMREISRLAAEHPKTPREVVLMENFHHLHAVLSRLRLPVLDKHKKDARARYTENLGLYVTNMLGKPLDKLHIFLDGVQNLIHQGVKAEEVSYQLAFNKQELRKVLKEYPGKEVKKGLEHLYRKVEKHLCEEENLLEVAWHSLQDEFLKLYKSYDTLITRCYQGADSKMEFSISDVLQYFSDIAHQH